MMYKVKLRVLSLLGGTPDTFSIYIPAEIEYNGSESLAGKYCWIGESCYSIVEAVKVDG